jgi:hypothetical protein
VTASAAPASQSPANAAPGIDPYSEFREDKSEGGILRLMPLAAGARTGKPANTAIGQPAESGSELQDLLARLSIPPQVAIVSYPRGCRIRRVRVPPPRDVQVSDTRQPVIVSRHLLQEKRATGSR